MSDKREASQNLPPATPEEVEWAKARVATGYSNDFIRRGIIAAATDSEALAFLRQYHHRGCGGCGPSGGPKNVSYWYEYDGDFTDAWFGRHADYEKGGPMVNPGWVPGARYARVSHKQIVHDIRIGETSPSLF